MKVDKRSCTGTLRPVTSDALGHWPLAPYVVVLMHTVSPQDVGGDSCDPNMLSARTPWQQRLKLEHAQITVLISLELPMSRIPLGYLSEKGR